jgi:hypothetical protein
MPRPVESNARKEGIKILDLRHLDAGQSSVNDDLRASLWFLYQSWGILDTIRRDLKEGIGDSIRRLVYHDLPQET